jgi:predicted nucleic acid-binding protein
VFSQHGSRVGSFRGSSVRVRTRPGTPTRSRSRRHCSKRACGRGLKGRKPVDLIIAAQAERLRLTVVHYDRDFEFIAAITDQPHEWIVPRGTID